MEFFDGQRLMTMLGVLGSYSTLQTQTQTIESAKSVTKFHSVGHY
jgi:hypothetical protein